MINLKHSEYGDVVVIVQRLSHVRLSATPWAADHQVHLSVGFPRQEYWGGLPFLFPGDLPNPRFKPASPALSGIFFTTEPPGKYDNILFYFEF